MWNVIDNLLFAAKAIGCACTVFTFIRLVTGESQTALKWSFPLLVGFIPFIVFPFTSYSGQDGVLSGLILFSSTMIGIGYGSLMWCECTRHYHY